MKYLLRNKNRGGREGSYFGGADMDDLWFCHKEKDAYLFDTKEHAEHAAKMYGLPGFRDWEVLEAETSFGN